MNWAKNTKFTQILLDSEKNDSILSALTLPANLSTSNNPFPNLNLDEFKICMQKFTMCFIIFFPLPNSGN